MDITLAMIVRDEEAILPRCLDAARPHINGAVIVDTGSTDRTRDIASQFISEQLDGRGAVLGHTWENFAANRNRLLEEARAFACNSGYLLLLDADHVCVGKLGDLTAGAYDVCVQDGDIRYWMPYLIRADKDYAYTGVTHECLTGYHAELERMPADWFHLDHMSDGAYRPQKYARDLALLVEANQNDPRNVFYLAQTYACLGHHEAAAETYRRRAHMGGWDEEVYVSLIRLGDELRILGQPAEATAEWLSAANYLPARGEAWRRLAGMWPGAVEHAMVAAATEQARLVTRDFRLFVEG